MWQGGWCFTAMVSAKVSAAVSACSELEVAYEHLHELGQLCHLAGVCHQVGLGGKGRARG